MKYEARSLSRPAQELSMSISLPQVPGRFESDVIRLLSHGGIFSEGLDYKEVAHEDAAHCAIRHWPLVAEVHGLVVAGHDDGIANSS
jgi:hypothetical protein